MRISSSFTNSVAAALAFSAIGVAGAIPAKADAFPCSIFCSAPTPGASGASSATETYGFVGLRWNFGAQAPAIAAGVRYTETETDDTVRGAKLDVSLDLKKDFTFTPVVRLLGIAGNRDAQAELGLGVDTSDWQLLAAGGVQLPYFNVGTNVTFDGSWAPYIEVSSLGRPKAPTIVNGTPTCATGYLFAVTNGTFTLNSTVFLADEASTVQGYTCYIGP